MIGRIIKEVFHNYNIEFNGNIYTGTVSGVYKFNVIYKSEFPTIGDYVEFHIENEKGIIDSLIPRKTVLSRKSSKGVQSEQVIAANIDKIILVFALDGSRNFTSGALERLLTISWDSGANPIIVLNKVDLCENMEEVLSIIETTALGVDVYYTSVLNKEGLDTFKQSLKEGENSCFCREIRSR